MNSNSARFTALTGIRYPLVQGPFGGGLSSVALTAAVSMRGGLGSFGGQPYAAAELERFAAEIRSCTDKPFALNLWVPHEEALAAAFSPADFQQLQDLFRPFFEEMGLPVPAQIAPVQPDFEKQAEAVLRVRPAVFSFVFGIPDAAILRECRKRGIVTVGAATAADEAMALEAAGVDAVVASGMEAGGHRPSFLHAPETVLKNLVSLLPEILQSVRIPVIAAGGLSQAADVRRVLQAGAAAAQVGTAFLACRESGATDLYRQVLRGPAGRETMLTRSFTGRLARGTRSILSEKMLDFQEKMAPWPLQSAFLAPLRKALLDAGRTDMLSFWAGSAAGKLPCEDVETLFENLVSGLTGQDSGG